MEEGKGQEVEGLVQSFHLGKQVLVAPPRMVMMNMVDKLTWLDLQHRFPLLLLPLQQLPFLAFEETSVILTMRLMLL